MTHPAAGTQVPDSSANSDRAPRPRPRRLGGDANNASRGLGAEGTGPLARKIIYFDFDKSEIKPEFADIVTAAAHALTANPQVENETRGQHRRARHARIQYRLGRTARAGRAQGFDASRASRSRKSAPSVSGPSGRRPKAMTKPPGRKIGAWKWSICREPRALLGLIAALPLPGVERLRIDPAGRGSGANQTEGPGYASRAYRTGDGQSSLLEVSNQLESLRSDVRAMHNDVDQLSNSMESGP